MSGLIIDQVVIVPAGEYEARVASVYETIVRGRLADMREMYLCWTFQIEGGPQAGQTVTGWTRPRFARGSRLFDWAQAALGQEIAPNYRLDTAALFGRSVRVLVQLVRDPKTAELHNRVAEVLPWPAGQVGG
jgi:hypothetical protein